MLDVTKLKASEIAGVRARLSKAQGNVCKLCKLPLGDGSKRPVLDHDHDTGFIRGVLHSGCNAMLGKIENNYQRMGVNLPAFLAGAFAYIQAHREPQHPLLHPTHKTDEEKRLARNARARKARAKKGTA